MGVLLVHTFILLFTVWNSDSAGFFFFFFFLFLKIQMIFWALQMSVKKKKTIQ